MPLTIDSHKKVRLGFIGFGAFARRTYWSWLRDNILAEVKAISYDLELFHKNAKEFEGVPYIFEYEKMLRTFPLDAVIISTPHALHFKQAQFCLNNNLHVLVDKPLACNIQQARELVELAHNKGKYLVVGAERRYETTYKMAKQVIEEGTIGEIRCIDCSFTRCVDTGFEESWRNDAYLSGGGVLLDSGYHIIDVILWMTGLSVTKSQGFITKDNLRVEKSCTISATLSNEAIASFLFTYVSPKSLKHEQIRFFGTEGVLEIVNYRPDGQKRSPILTLQTNNSPVALNIADNNKVNSSAEGPLKNLIEAILYQYPLVSEAGSTLPSLQFISALYEKAEENR